MLSPKITAFENDIFSAFCWVGTAAEVAASGANPSSDKNDRRASLDINCSVRRSLIKPAPRGRQPRPSRPPFRQSPWRQPRKKRLRPVC